MPKIVVIAHNLRSTHNVGSLLRTADGLGVKKVYLTGYTPYPQTSPETRLPHIAAKITKQIHKTALGAEMSVDWQYEQDVQKVLQALEHESYQVYGLEQTTGSIPLPSFQPPESIAVVLGREVEGIEAEILAQCHGVLEIPMQGQKESFNVVQAAAMALYHISYVSRSSGAKR